jgi:uncharacterized protein (UPF0303 family)
MTEETDRLVEQESQLVFPGFTDEDAWELGCRMRERALEEKLPLAICIENAGRVLFRCDLPGTAPDNGVWMEGKTRTVYRFGHSSFLVGTRLREKGTSIENSYFLEEREFRAHGGSFPIRLVGGLLVGTVTVSGLPQEEDHRFVVESLADWLGKDLNPKE